MSIEEINTVRAGMFRTARREHRREPEPYMARNIGKSPFYRQLLEDYLGRSHTNEMYEELFDEVARDVDFRIKQLNLQSI
jgi:hypothetical protein